MAQLSKLDLGNLTKQVRAWRILAISILAIVLVSYFGWFGLLNKFGLATSTDAWGQAGDFIGGVLNPVLAYFAFYWLTVSVIVQKSELETLNENARESKAVEKAQRQADTLARLFDQLSDPTIGASMRAIGRWYGMIVEAFPVGSPAPSPEEIQNEYKADLVKMDRDKLVDPGGVAAAEMEAVESARRVVKNWFIKCYLYRASGDLTPDGFSYLISRDRAKLMLNVIAMTRGQTEWWQEAQRMSAEERSCSDDPVFEDLIRFANEAYGIGAGA